MATIRASCPDCGDVELTTQDMVVRVCVDDNRGSYAFRCPECLMTISKAAEQRIVDLLVSTGIRVEAWNLPRELRERPAGEPLTHDDVLAFHELLQGDNWFSAVADLLESEGYYGEQRGNAKLSAVSTEPETEDEAVELPLPINLRRPRWQDVLRSHLHRHV